METDTNRFAGMRWLCGTLGRDAAGRLTSRWCVVVTRGSSIALMAFIVLAVSGCASAVAGVAHTASSSHRASSAVDDFNHAQTLVGKGQCDRAIPLYLQAIRKNPMYVSAYNSLGQCYQSVGSPNAAILQYDKAIVIDPMNYGLYIARAGAEVQNGSGGAAAADDGIALRLAPPQAPAYSSIASSYFSFADIADAVKAMNMAIAKAPDVPALYEQRAGYYLAEFDTQDAFTDYQQALKVAPFAASRAGVYADLSQVYATQGNYDSAFRAISTAIQIEPGNAHFYVQSGDIHQNAGSFREALALYDHALRLVSRGSDAESAHEGKGDVLAKQGRVNQAIAEYRRAAPLARKDQNVQARLKNKIEAARSGQS